jgi:hypothetical protein
MIADIMAKIETASDRVERSQPNSSVIGLMNTPKAWLTPAVKNIIR